MEVIMQKELFQEKDDDIMDTVQRLDDMCNDPNIEKATPPTTLKVRSK
jgi:hypothetical protein